MDEKSTIEGSGGALNYYIDPEGRGKKMSKHTSAIRSRKYQHSDSLLAKYA